MRSGTELSQFLGILPTYFGMVNVDFRVKQLRLGQAHKFFNDRCPSYLSESFVKTSDIHCHNTKGVVKTLLYLRSVV